MNLFQHCTYFDFVWPLWHELSRSSPKHFLIFLASDPTCAPPPSSSQREITLKQPEASCLHLSTLVCTCVLLSTLLYAPSQFYKLIKEDIKIEILLFIHSSHIGHAITRWHKKWLLLSCLQDFMSLHKSIYEHWASPLTGTQMWFGQGSPPLSWHPDKVRLVWGSRGFHLVHLVY